MTKEIKYCLLGAVISYIISIAFTYYEVMPIITNLFKVVYIGFTFSLVYFVIRLLTTAETQKSN